MFNQNFGELKGGMKFAAAIMSLLMIVGGILMMFAVNYMPAIGVFFFGALVVIGLFQICKYFAMKDMRNGWDIIGGVLNIGIGIIMLLSDAETRFYGMYVVELFLAIWAIFGGFAHIFGAFGKANKGKSKVASVIFGILLILVGILMLAFPVRNTIGIVTWGRLFASIALVIGGFSGLAFVLSGKKAIKSAVEDVTEV